MNLRSGRHNDPKWIKNYVEPREHTQIPLPGHREHQNWEIWQNYATTNIRSQGAYPSHTLCLQDSRGSKVVLGTQSIEISAGVQVISRKIF